MAAIDPSIPLSLQKSQSSVSEGILKYYQAKQFRENADRQVELDEQQQELNAIKIMNAKLDAADKRETRRFTNLAYDSKLINESLQSGDIDSARAVLENRRTNLVKLQTIDPSIDTTETDDALRMLDEDPEMLRKLTGVTVKTAQARGLLTDDTKPVIVAFGS